LFGIGHDVVSTMTSRPTFDLHERDRIRYSLLRYKIAHGIGAPMLAKRISEANLNCPIVNHKRVSRYLAKQHDPEDIFVGWCDTFLQSVPVPPDPIWQLAKGLLGFCATGSAVDFSGSYTLSQAVPAVADSFWRIADPDISAKLTATADDGFWRLEERALHRKAIWDGVLINTNTGGLAILKERLTCVTKTYTLQPEGDVISGSTVWVDNNRITRSHVFELTRNP
jgi:hypothetical protein